jgi:hypothetical protein
MKSNTSVSFDGGEQHSDRANGKTSEKTEHEVESFWLTYFLTMSSLMAMGVLVVMVLCTVRREQLTVWMMWGSEYLYSIFWVLEWHLIVSIGLSIGLRALESWR